MWWIWYWNRKYKTKKATWAKHCDNFVFSQYIFRTLLTPLPSVLLLVPPTGSVILPFVAPRPWHNAPSAILRKCLAIRFIWFQTHIVSLIARFMGPTWSPSGSDRTQVGSMLAPWTLLSGMIIILVESGHVQWKEFRCGEYLQLYIYIYIKIYHRVSWLSAHYCFCEWYNTIPVMRNYIPKTRRYIRHLY